MPEECQLVDVAKTFPSLHIDLKYATADNITGRPIYQEARCLLHTDAVTALAKAISIATLAGLKLVVYDAYRPQQAQAQLWDACPDPEYVVDVATGSNHSRGTAIDVTLMDEHNTVLDMGAGFDEMHDRSHPYHPSVLPMPSATACYSTPSCLAAALWGSAVNGGILSCRTRPVIPCLKIVLTVSR
jgi:D-alanyl-D-alanine dipeptidase